MLYIGGAGGFGRETYDAILSQESTLVHGEAPGNVCFLDHHRCGSSVRGLPVLSPSAASPHGEYVVAIAATATRMLIAAELTRAGLRPRTVFHKASIIGPESQPGLGNVFLAFSHVSSSVSLGDHVHVNYNATIGHDCVIEDFVTILPGANVAGSVLLEEGVTVGSGAVVLPGITIGAHATIGAGAVVTRDVKPHTVVKGVPAR